MVASLCENDLNKMFQACYLSKYYTSCIGQNHLSVRKLQLKLLYLFGNEEDSIMLTHSQKKMSQQVRNKKEKIARHDKLPLTRHDGLTREGVTG